MKALSKCKWRCLIFKINEPKQCTILLSVPCNSNGKCIYGLDKAKKFTENINRVIRNCVFRADWSWFHLAGSHDGIYLMGISRAASACWSSVGRCFDGKTWSYWPDSHRSTTFKCSSYNGWSISAALDRGHIQFMWDDPFEKKKLAHNNCAVYTELSALMKHSSFSLCLMTRPVLFIFDPLNFSQCCFFGMERVNQAHYLSVSHTRLKLVPD